MTSSTLQTAAAYARGWAQAHDGSLGLLATTGSRAYGTNRPESDWDFRGVYVSEFARFCSMRGPKDSIVQTEPFDVTVYEVGHFARLASKANPTVLETLWADDFVSTPLGDLLKENRDLFLSKQVTKSYGGYALGQLERAKRGVGGSRGQDHYKRMKFKLHTLRLILAGIHILDQGEVLVKVSDPAALRDMADKPIAEVEKTARELIKEMDRAAIGSLLPEQPDVERIDALLARIRIDRETDREFERQCG